MVTLDCSGRAFKGNAFNNSGTGLVKQESAQAGVQLVALGTYVAGTTMWA